MNACTVVSASHLLAAALTFLLAVLWLEMFGSGSPQNCIMATLPAHLGSEAGLNALVALGVGGAAILLVLWVSSCTNAGF